MAGGKFGSALVNIVNRARKGAGLPKLKRSQANTLIKRGEVARKAGITSARTAASSNKVNRGFLPTKRPTKRTARTGSPAPGRKRAKVGGLTAAGKRAQKKAGGAGGRKKRR